MPDEWILPLTVDVEALKECAAAICEAWSEAVVEDTAAGEFAFSVEALVPTEESELCVYQSLEVARKWQQGGPAGDLHNTMIQIGLTPLGVRLIADDWQDPALCGIVEQMERTSGRIPHASCNSGLSAQRRLPADDHSPLAVDRLVDDRARQVS